MVEKKLEIEIENVAGFKGVHKFILNRGLNVAKAPNSTGKTSLIKAIELASMADKDLRGKGYYMNLMADSTREQARVKMMNEFSIERRFRRVGDDLSCVEGAPLFQNGKRATTVCFAMPDNELINKMLAGESIRGFIEDFSDSVYYDDTIKLVTEIKIDLDRKHQLYRSDLIRLEQEQENLEEERKNLKEKLSELEKLPKIDESLALEDKKLKNEYDRKRGDKRVLDDKIRSTRVNVNELDSSIEDYQSKIEMNEARLKDIGRDQKIINDQMDEVEKELRLVKNDVSKFDVQLKRIDDELQSVKDNFQKRQKYDEEKRCVACGQPLSLKHLQDWENELRSSKEDFQKQLKEAKRRREDLEEEDHKLKRDILELGKYNDELKSVQKTKAEKERQRNNLKTELNKLESELQKLENQIKDIWSNIDEESVTILMKRTKIQDQIDDIKARIESRENRINELSKKTSEAEVIVDRIEFTENAIQHLRHRKEEVIDAVRKTFNKRIIEIYKNLGFKDFENIEIRKGDFTVYIRRPHYNEEWPLNALSTSERVTLAVTLLIAGKQEYMPDYPFFVLDELVTSYDPDRFKKLKEYIANVTEYVVVTQLVEAEDSEGKVTIEHVAPVRVMA